MTNYQRGDYREKRVMQALQAHGWECWQSRASHGYADVIAMRLNRTPMLIQVKSGKASVRHDEWNGLFRLASRTGAVPVVVTMVAVPGKVRPIMQWLRVVDLHTMDSRDWPSRALLLG